MVKITIVPEFHFLNHSHDLVMLTFRGTGFETSDTHSNSLNRWLKSACKLTLFFQDPIVYRNFILFICVFSMRQKDYNPHVTVGIIGGYPLMTILHICIEYSIQSFKFILFQTKQQKNKLYLLLQSYYPKYWRFS